MIFPPVVFILLYHVGQYLGLWVCFIWAFFILTLDIETVKFNDNSGAEDEDLHSETVDEEVFEQINSAEKIGNEISQNGKDVPEKNVDETEQSVTIEEITSGNLEGNAVHTRIVPKRIPKEPKDGSCPAVLAKDDILLTSGSYLDSMD